MWKRYRFKVGIEETRGDYGPVKWLPVGPYWCSGKSDEHFILIAYVKDEAQIKEFWPEAQELELDREDEAPTFSSRFPKPSWWNN